MAAQILYPEGGYTQWTRRAFHGKPVFNATAVDAQHRPPFHFSFADLRLSNEIGKIVFV